MFYHVTSNSTGSLLSDTLQQDVGYKVRKIPDVSKMLKITEYSPYKLNTLHRVCTIPASMNKSNTGILS